MSVAINLVPGRYYAGFTRPWYATQGMVTSRLEDGGLKNVVWHSREDSQPPVNPKSDPGYSDNWDEWISVDMPVTKVVELPGRPPWIVAAPTPRVKLPTSSKPGTGPSPGEAPPLGDPSDPPPLSIISRPDPQNAPVIALGLTLILIGAARGRRKNK